MRHRPPKNDEERLENLLEALSEPGDDDDAIDELMHAELARRGHTLESLVAHYEARGQTVIEDARRARRKRRFKIAAVVAAGVAAVAATGGVIAHRAMRGLQTPADVQQSLDPSRP